MNKNFLTVILAILTTIGFLSTIKVCGTLFLRELSEFEDRPTYVPLYKGDSGFYVLAKVFLNDNTSERVSIKMFISAYSSISMLAGQCLNFSIFDCQKYQCEYSNSTIGYSFPYFTAEGPSIKVDLELGDWSLNTQAILSSRCVDCYLSSYGNGVYGIIGLGVGAGNASANYNSDPIFSIYFSPNEPGGALAFSKDTRRILPGTQPIVIPVDNNWRTQSIQGVKVGDKEINYQAKLIFDFNEETFAFSLKTFKRIMIDLNNGPVPIKCNNRGQKDFYRPDCTYHGELKDLPNITILVENEVLIIHPEQYVKDPETFDSTIGNLTLNMKAIYDTVHTPENHVTADYKADIIVGLPFLKDYYVVFNGTNSTGSNNTIEFYIPNHDLEKSFNELWLIIILAIVIPGSFILILTDIIKKRKDRHIENPLLANVEEEHHPIQIQNIPQHNNEESRVIQRDNPFNVDDPSVHTIPHQSEASEPGSTLYFTK